MDDTPLYNLRVKLQLGKLDFSKEDDPQGAIRQYSSMLEAARDVFEENHLQSDGLIRPGTFGGLPSLEMVLSVDDNIQQLGLLAQGFQGATLHLQYGKASFPCAVIDGTAYLKDFMTAQLLAKRAAVVYRAAERKGR
jgi:hypothetical protein